eukprot:1685857-Ditylum_brightwellii.AAC.1
MKKGKGNLATIIKNIKHCKELKLAFQQMKPITKRETGSTFQHEELYAVTDGQDEVMSTLIARNKLLLHQAFVTPFATKEIQIFIGQFETGTEVKEILDGKFDPNI